MVSEWSGKIASCSEKWILFLFLLPKVALAFWQLRPRSRLILSLESIKTSVFFTCVIDKPLPITHVWMVFIFKLTFVPDKFHDALFSLLLKLLKPFWMPLALLSGPVSHMG